MTQEPLTIENLARAIHEDSQIAAHLAGITLTCRGKPQGSFDELSNRWKKLRREQARLMLNRWMR